LGQSLLKPKELFIMSESYCKDSCCETVVEAVNEQNVPSVSTNLELRDVMGAIKVRCGIGRMNYKVEPGLYAVGKPNCDSLVLVSGNYKLTFDILRKNLVGMNCWLLILDTQGVNVWCAAGKKLFSTDELVNRIEITQLSKIVSHRKLILPQLGAPAIDAFQVSRRTGFSVTFGPVRANDIQLFVANGFEVTKEMRLVKFNFVDRLVLTPVELVNAVKKSLPIMGVLLATNQFAKRPFTKRDVAAYARVVLTGSVLTPLLLPYIPGKAFAWKGWLLGAGWTAFSLCKNKGFTKGSKVMSAGQMLLLPAVSSYLAMNFTGSSTYTSASGVEKEMRIALPLIIGAGSVGAALMLGSHLFGKGK